MMEHFKNWYVRNQDAITWFLIGLLTSGMLDQLVKRDYWMALLSAVLIWVNYKMSKVRLQ